MVEASPQEATVTENKYGVGVGLAEAHGGGVVDDVGDAAVGVDDVEARRQRVRM